jgi:hypothetical protein
LYNGAKLSRVPNMPVLTGVIADVDLADLPDLVAVGVDRGQADQVVPLLRARHENLLADVWVMAATTESSGRAGRYAALRRFLPLVRKWPNLTARG